MNKLVAHYEESIRLLRQDLANRPDLRDVLEPELHIAEANLALAKRVLGLYA